MTSYLNLLNLAAPETIMVLVALIVLVLDLTTMRELGLRTRLSISALFASVGCVAATLWMLVMPQHASALDGMLVVDPLTQMVKIAILALTVFTVLLSID